MSYLLLTGATGLLGGYLLRDALRAGLSVAVVVRRTAVLSARRRIDAVLAPFEREHALPRPFVLEGDLSKPNLGLAASDLQWLRDHCTSVLHSAASISFYREEPRADGGPVEPYRTNVDGTRNLLELCRSCGIDQFHHVSTAYVCGRRSGRVLESELEVGQEHGNDYEASKVAAEKLIRSAGLRQPPTIYRPSIIVGDAETGYTTTFHGFYTPIQVAWWLAKSGVLRSGVDHWFLEQLGLSGNERKNIVPVDWVSRVILHLLMDGAAHGRTYHLTCDNPPTAMDLAEAIGDVLKPRLASPNAQNASPPSTVVNAPAEMMEADFRRHMDVYRAYFRDHPEFDTTNVQQAAPHLPCPTVDRPMLARTGKFALDANFGWPRIQPPRLTIDVDQLLEHSSRLVGADALANKTFLLEVTGCGGGAWSLGFDESRSVTARVGRTETADATIRLRSDTLAALIEQRLDLDQALLAGRVVILAEPIEAESASRWLKRLIENNPSAANAQGNSLAEPLNASRQVTPFRGDELSAIAR